MNVAKKSPIRERIQRTSSVMLSAVDCGFQWNMDPNTARSMAYRGIPKVRSSDTVNAISSQCPLRTVMCPGKIEIKGVVIAVVPKKRKASRLITQVTNAPIIERAMSAPMQMKKNLKTPRNISPTVWPNERSVPED